MYKFHKYDDDGQVICQYDIEDCSWPDVVEKFQEFLAGCGYIFYSGFDMAGILEAAHAEVIEKRQVEVNQQLPLDLGEYK